MPVRDCLFEQLALVVASDRDEHGPRAEDRRAGQRDPGDRRIVGRIEPRFDRTTGTLEVLGAWGDTSRAEEALASLAEWLGAGRIERRD